MTSITIKEYFSRKGSLFSHTDARKIGPVLHELSQQGGVTARDVLDAARSTNSPLHPYFEWNDKVAADQYRLDQARVMLRAIRVRVVEDGEEYEVRAFQVQTSSAGIYDNGPRAYRSFQILHGDSAFAAQMLGSAFDDLSTWKRKYEPYVNMWQKFGDAFQGVVNQIDEWTEEYRSQNIAGETDDALARLITWRDQSANALETWAQCREQVEFIMEAIADAEKTFAVLDMQKERPCIRCQKPFKSAHAGNRICLSCGRTQKIQSGVGETTVEFTME